MQNSSQMKYISNKINMKTQLQRDKTTTNLILTDKKDIVQNTCTRLNLISISKCLTPKIHATTCIPRMKLNIETIHISLRDLIATTYIMIS